MEAYEELPQASLECLGCRGWGSGLKSRVKGSWWRNLRVWGGFWKEVASGPHEGSGVASDSGVQDIGRRCRIQG